MSTATIVDPTGVPARIETKRPIVAHITDVKAEQIITALKLLNTRIADNAGKITKAEISREPTKFIAKTMIIAVIIAINKLYIFAFVPVAFVKFSSKVTEKILL